MYQAPENRPRHFGSAQIAVVTSAAKKPGILVHLFGHRNRRCSQPTYQRAGNHLQMPGFVPSGKWSVRRIRIDSSSSSFVIDDAQPLDDEVQKSYGLLAAYRGIVVKKIVYTFAGLKMLKQHPYRHAGTEEDWRSA